MMRGSAFRVGEGGCVQFYLFGGEADCVVGGGVGGGGGGLGLFEAAADDDFHTGFLQCGEGFGFTSGWSAILSCMRRRVRHSMPDLRSVPAVSPAGRRSGPGSARVAGLPPKNCFRRVRNPGFSSGSEDSGAERAGRGAGCSASGIRNSPGRKRGVPA